MNVLIINAQENSFSWYSLSNSNIYREFSVHWIHIICFGTPKIMSWHGRVDLHVSEILCYLYRVEVDTDNISFYAYFRSQLQLHKYKTFFCMHPQILWLNECISCNWKLKLHVCFYLFVVRLTLLALTVFKSKVYFLFLYLNKIRSDPVKRCY